MVKAWKEDVVIPTYEIGAPEKNPIFLEKRVYQGSSGAVYPYPVVETIADEKVDRTWKAIFLENEYIKVMVLPELGGRIQMAYDKIRKRHFVYYNHVIKPAMVGLTGPWISGGIEFNWPQHHRPSTYLPVDSTIEENADGSVTVWVSELERMTHQKGMAGFTLRPGCACLEIKGALYNPTDVPQTFLWWANPAVAVNDHYRSVFPPDINAVFDHGKRAVSTFPIATGTYYKMDYSSGVDIANYKNIFVPTSYMGVNSKYDFEGGYEFDTQAGMLHVANHHVSPGKKQWTWGNGDFGRAWDRNLTDDDGPYIELMAGVFTENQPDFSWLMPYEEKEFKQYFIPYRELGVVKNASRDLLMNIEEAGDGKIKLMLFATRKLNIRIELEDKERNSLWKSSQEISPENVSCQEINLDGYGLCDLSLMIHDNEGKKIMSWEMEPDQILPIPDSAEAALQPTEVKTNEQLYLTGLHLEQYRHATFSPLDYYEEALRRDPDDYRCNNAMGLWYLRKCRFDLAEQYLTKAVKTLTRRNPNPYDGEPLYNLGLALKYQGRLDEAYDRFYKSTWNGAWQDAGFLACARISTIQGRHEDALYETERSLRRNLHNHKARTLRAALLSITGNGEEAVALCDESLAIDRFNFGSLLVKYAITRDEQVKTLLVELMHGSSHNYDEVGIEFCDSGLYDLALLTWDIAHEAGSMSVIANYYRGYCLLCAGKPEGADAAFKAGAAADPDFVFPNSTYSAIVLSTAAAMNPTDGNARHFLGNLYYDKRQYDLAIRYWEEASEILTCYPTVWRNLALAYFNKRGDAAKSLDCMEKAFSLDTTDGRVLMELDQLYKRLNRTFDMRLANLQKYPNLVAGRDDLILEEITLLNQTGKWREAMEKLDSHIFHPWEGGEGKISFQYQYSRVELAKEAIREGKIDAAAELLEQCLVYPHNLGEGKLYGAQENDFYYLLGVCHAIKGDRQKAEECWRKATVGPEDPAPALYYNDARPDKIFYAGMAFRALGDENKARSYFNRLVNYGRQHYHNKVKIDYFAVSLPDLLIWDGDLDLRNRIHCLYMLALGELGLGQTEKGMAHLSEAEHLDPGNMGIMATRSFISNIMGS